MSKLRPPIAHNRAVIAQRARSFRHHMNAEEVALWAVLRGSRLGVRFVRQRVIGPFIADFAAPAVRLVVEVDGEYHAGRLAADSRRDEKLRRWGWRVVRVSAREVMRDLPAVVARVGEALRVS